MPRKKIIGRKKSGLPQLLYVEDDDMSREVVVMFLKNVYKVETAANSEEALSVLNKKIFDAVLMDIDLCSRMGGIELAKEIKKISANSNVPIIAVTAYSFKEDMKKILASGCSHYISKPFSRESLLNKIEEALNN